MGGGHKLISLPIRLYLRKQLVTVFELETQFFTHSPCTLPKNVNFFEFQIFNCTFSPFKNCQKSPKSRKTRHSLFNSIFKTRVKKFSYNPLGEFPRKDFFYFEN